jgi:hypothetical protein
MPIYAYLGLVLLLFAIGLLVRVALDLRNRRSTSTLRPDADEENSSLMRDVAARVEADRRRGIRRYTLIGCAAFLVGTALLLAQFTVRSSPPGKDGQNKSLPGPAPLGPDLGKNPPVTPLEPPPPSASAFPMALVILNSVLLGIGMLLLLFGHDKTVKAAGVISMVAGLTGHGYLQLKIDKLFGIEKLLSFGDPRLKVEIEKVLAEGVRSSGPELIGEFPNFAIGSADLKKANFDGQAEINRVCSVWQQHSAKGQDGVLLIVGASDRLPLRGRLAAQYDANVGLAQARAEQVRKHLLDCINAPYSLHSIKLDRILTLASGPETTPEGNPRRTAPPHGYPGDRRVDVWAFWTSEKKP